MRDNKTTGTLSAQFPFHFNLDQRVVNLHYKVTSMYNFYRGVTNMIKYKYKISLVFWHS